MKNKITCFLLCAFFVSCGCSDGASTEIDVNTDADIVNTCLSNESFCLYPTFYYCGPSNQFLSVSCPDISMVPPRFAAAAQACCLIEDSEEIPEIMPDLPDFIEGDTGEIPTDDLFEFVEITEEDIVIEDIADEREPIEIPFDETIIEGSPSLWGVSGSSRTDVYAVGNEGVIAAFGGADWSIVRTIPGVYLSDISYSGSEYWVAGGTQTLLHGSGAGWLGAVEDNCAPWDSNPDIISLCARSAEVFILFDEMLHTVPGCRFDITRSRWSAFTSGLTGQPSDVWADDDLIVIASPSDSLHVYDRSAGTWETETTLNSMWGVAGGGESVWAVGSEGTIMRYIDGVWTSYQSVSSRALERVCVNSAYPDIVYAVGPAGIFVYDHISDEWLEVLRPTPTCFHDCWISPDPDPDVFIVGASGLILHHSP